MSARRLALGLAAVCVALFLMAGSAEFGNRAQALGDDVTDTPGCAAKYEFELLKKGDTLEFVQTRFDTAGRQEATGPNQFPWSFKPCPGWDAADGKRVWTWYDNDDGLLRRWALRDITTGALTFKGGDWS